MIKDNKEYKQQMKHVNSMPKDYKFVFKKIQSYMWMFTSGAGYDMIEVQQGLVELFDSGISSGKKVLEITGNDVAAFCEELLRNCKTYTGNWRDKLNREIQNGIVDK